MWFDRDAALKQLSGGDMPPPDTVPRVAQIARVARPHPSKSGTSEGGDSETNTRARSPDPATEQFLGTVKRELPGTGTPETQTHRPNFPSIKGAEPPDFRRSNDVDLYLAALTLHGPMTYGAAAVALRWGATRAWLAEAALVTRGSAILTRAGCASVNTS